MFSVSIGLFVCLFVCLFVVKFYLFFFLSGCLLATLLKRYEQITIKFYGMVRGGERNVIGL